MAVDNWVLVGIPSSVPIAEATAEDYVFSHATEFSHEIENELKERVIGKRKDWSGGVVEETIELSFPYDYDLKSDRALLDSAKNGQQMRFWFINKQLDDANEHNSVFAYVVAESRSLSVDDEEETIEGTFKVKFNTAEGKEPRLPDVILDESLAGAVKYENIGQETGDLETVAFQDGVNGATDGTTDTAPDGEI